MKAEKAYEWGLLDELVDGSLLPPFDQHVYNKFGIDVKNGDHALRRAIELADSIGFNDSAMVRRYKRAIVEGGNVDLQKGLQRERELGMAHYIEVVGDGTTFEGAKGFIADENRHRAGNSKL